MASDGVKSVGREKVSGSQDNKIRHIVSSEPCHHFREAQELVPWEKPERMCYGMVTVVRTVAAGLS